MKRPYLKIFFMIFILMNSFLVNANNQKYQLFSRTNLEFIILENEPEIGSEFKFTIPKIIQLN